MNHSRTIELKSRDERITLRPPDLDDASSIHEAVLVSKQELMPWMDWCRPDYSKEVTIEWLRNLPVEWEQGESYQFGIFDTLSGQFLGVCGLNHIN
jgi:RimJ/RimL family protein N-acetyltransferase